MKTYFDDQFTAADTVNSLNTMFTLTEQSFMSYEMKNENHREDERSGTS